MADAVRIGVVGCGAISAAYFKMAKNFPILDLVAVADLDRPKAEARAAEFGVPRVCSVDELIAADDIEIVLNLTIPKAHVPVGRAALEAGKHAYSEKPLGVNRTEGFRLLNDAAKLKLMLGCAPDTVLGAGIQTARQVIDQGLIGKPVGFTAFCMGRGPEGWHPNPEFYYEVGGGPMFDMGPYYLTTLLQLLGPVKRLASTATIAIPKRVIGSEPKKGKKINVETPEHICATIEFVNGCSGTLITSFATLFPEHGSPITIYGDQGTLKVPDPNGFDGQVWIRKEGDDAWQEVPHTFVEGYGRAVGLADMASALRHKRDFRCNADVAFAVLDLMQGSLDSAATGQHHVPERTFKRPKPMPADLPFGQLD